jgi:hypothetical protein
VLITVRINHPRKDMVKCLVQFYQDIDWKTFRLAELDALIEEALGPTDGTPPFDASRYYSRPSGIESPFVVLELPSFDVAQRLCARSVLIKHVYELWSRKFAVARYLNILDSDSPAINCRWTFSKSRDQSGSRRVAFAP